MAVTGVFVFRPLDAACQDTTRRLVPEPVKKLAQISAPDRSDQNLGTDLPPSVSDQPNKPVNRFALSLSKAFETAGTQ
ncbi:MAG: hypothetical protein ACRD3W_08650, partial [Terriglobales bacterium]